MVTSEKELYVAMVFFARPEPLKKVFETVRNARPKKLFLIQDGPRNDADVEKINACRRVVENIDWDCEVYTNYSDKNLGCGQRIYSGIQWAFEYVDRLVILEDDCVPASSFFPFCQELLDKYVNDLRVGMISGMNHLGCYQEANTDYIFTNVGSIAGWATWKRCWDAIDFNLNFLSDPYIQRLLEGLQKHGSDEQKRGLKRLKAMQAKIEAGEKLSSWSFQYGISSYMNSQYIIVPKYNLMTNCGVTENATNSPSDMKLIPKKMQRLYDLKAYEGMFSLPLKHPKYATIDYMYSKSVRDFMVGKNWFDRFGRRMESFMRRLFFGDVKGLWRAVKRRFQRKR